MCVIEPEVVLPGGMYGFSSANAAELQRRGEHDAWLALEAAGWIEGGAHAVTLQNYLLSELEAK